MTIQARIEHGVINVELSSDNSAAHDALRSALPALQQDLRDGGYTGVAVDIGGGSRPDAGSGQSARTTTGRPDPDTASGARRGAADPITTGSIRPTADDSALDRWL